MPSTFQRSFRPKHHFHNGTLLAVSEAAELVNIPLAQDVAKHIKQVVFALKAPKTNDSNARDLANRVQGLVDVLKTVVQHLNESRIATTGIYSDVLAELRELQTLLSATHKELQDIQNTQYTNKLASQVDIQECIMNIKEELSRTIINITLRLLLVVLASSAQSQLLVVHRLDSVTQEHNTLARSHGTLAHKHRVLVRKHNALIRDSHQHRRISDQRIRALTRRVNAVLLARQKDGRVACLVLLNGVVIFF